MSPDPDRPATALGDRLRELRAGPFRSGSELARHLGWQQSKVSRIEHGRQLPTRSDLDRWARAAGADDEARAALHDLLDRAHVSTVSNAAAGRRPGGLESLQDDLRDLERASTLVAEYQPHLVPGLAQTPAYTRAWLTQAARPGLAGHVDVEGIVAARSARQAILHEPGRRVVLAMGEGALRSVHGPAEVQRRQLGYLQVIADLPAVELLVEPFTAATATLRGFQLLDDRVLLEDADGTRHLTDPDVVTRFRGTLDAVRERAVTGEAVITLLGDVMESLPGR
ncbi:MULTISPECIES: helix-turn-helix transcriptional regulator [unclassified Pseudonocardia]|uniref:helix-turn-helix domain-containing protein n=1 Tax=unclassified Pseudonocardia TaxID=2619320 RepID=UPI0001FFE361|nr:helix-turn-helix transcriptional regulator [Pseudonocardia sp. Ae707_Ps1]OLM16858.1 putative DNA-binding protein [Pseudonocardia sp. Ae707_Ps1]